MKAVLFDYFGTLTPSLAEITSPAERIAMGEVLGVDPTVLHEAWAASFEDRSTGRTGDVQATLRMLARATGADPTDEQVAAAAEIRMTAYRRTSLPRPETVGVLKELRARGLRIAVVSDCSDELVELWPGLPQAEFVDAMVFSSVVGVRKPAPIMYRLACERLGVEAGECLYVGDGGSNELTGATAFGIRAVLLADAKWAAGHRYDADEWAGETIHELAAVLDLV